MASENHSTSCLDDPNFATICSFLEKFGELCHLGSIPFAQLQEMLENTSEVPLPLVQLHIRLLRRVFKSINTTKWEKSVSKFAHMFNSQDGWEVERFGYKKSKIQTKLRILKNLLESQFDYNTKFKGEVNKLLASDLRMVPLGRDHEGHAYWYQVDAEANLRVYREDIDDETWDIVASSRDEMEQLITQLKNGEIRKGKSSDDNALDDDVNGLESMDIEPKEILLDTGKPTEMDDGNDSSDESDNLEIADGLPDADESDDMQDQDMEAKVNTDENTSDIPDSQVKKDIILAKDAVCATNVVENPQASNITLRKDTVKVAYGIENPDTTLGTLPEDEAVDAIEDNKIKQIASPKHTVYISDKIEIPQNKKDTRPCKEDVCIADAIEKPKNKDIKLSKDEVCVSDAIENPQGKDIQSSKDKVCVADVIEKLAEVNDNALKESIRSIKCHPLELKVQSVESSLGLEPSVTGAVVTPNEIEIQKGERSNNASFLHKDSNSDFSTKNSSPHVIVAPVQNPPVPPVSSDKPDSVEVPMLADTTAVDQSPYFPTEIKSEKSTLHSSGASEMLPVATVPIRENENVKSLMAVMETALPENTGVPKLNESDNNLPTLSPYLPCRKIEEAVSCSESDVSVFKQTSLPQPLATVNKMKSIGSNKGQKSTHLTGIICEMIPEKLEQRPEISEKYLPTVPEKMEIDDSMEAAPASSICVKVENESQVTQSSKNDEKLEPVESKYPTFCQAPQDSATNLVTEPEGTLTLIPQPEIKNEELSAPQANIATNVEQEAKEKRGIMMESLPFTTAKAEQGMSVTAYVDDSNAVRNERVRESSIQEEKLILKADNCDINEVSSRPSTVEIRKNENLEQTDSNETTNDENRLTLAHDVRTTAQINASTLSSPLARITGNDQQDTLTLIGAVTNPIDHIESRLIVEGASLTQTEKCAQSTDFIVPTTKQPSKETPMEVKPYTPEATHLNLNKPLLPLINVQEAVQTSEVKLECDNDRLNEVPPGEEVVSSNISEPPERKTHVVKNSEDNNIFFKPSEQVIAHSDRHSIVSKCDSVSSSPPSFQKTAKIDSINTGLPQEVGGRDASEICSKLGNVIDPTKADTTGSSSYVVEVAPSESKENVAKRELKVQSFVAESANSKPTDRVGSPKPEEESKSIERLTPPIEESKSAERSSTPMEQSKIVETSPSRMAESKSAEGSSTPLEEGKIVETSPSRMAESKSAEGSSTPLEEGKIVEKSPSPMEESKSAERSSTPTEENKIVETSPSFMEESKSAERASTPMEESKIGETSPSPMEESKSVQRSPTPMEETKGLDMSPTPVEESKSVEISPTPVEESKRAEMSPTPVKESKRVERSPTPVKERKRVERSPTPVKESKRVERSPTPVKESKRVERSPTPVKESITADRATSPVDDSNSKEILPTPMEEIKILEMTLTPMEESKSVERSPTPVAESQSFVNELKVTEVEQKIDSQLNCVNMNDSNADMAFQTKPADEVHSTDQTQNVHDNLTEGKERVQPRPQPVTSDECSEAQKVSLLATIPTATGVEEPRLISGIVDQTHTSESMLEAGLSTQAEVHPKDLCVSSEMPVALETVSSKQETRDQIVVMEGPSPMTQKQQKVLPEDISSHSFENLVKTVDGAVDRQTEIVAEQNSIPEVKLAFLVSETAPEESNNYIEDKSNTPAILLESAKSEKESLSESSTDVTSIAGVPPTSKEVKPIFGLVAYASSSDDENEVEMHGEHTTKLSKESQSEVENVGGQKRKLEDNIESEQEAKIPKIDDKSANPIVGEAIEEELMIISGAGEGALNEGGNDSSSGSPLPPDLEEDMDEQEQNSQDGILPSIPKGRGRPRKNPPKEVLKDKNMSDKTTSEGKTSSRRSSFYSDDMNGASSGSVRRSGRVAQIRQKEEEERRRLEEERLAQLKAAQVRKQQKQLEKEQKAQQQPKPVVKAPKERKTSKKAKSPKAPKAVKQKQVLYLPSPSESGSESEQEEEYNGRGARGGKRGRKKKNGKVMKKEPDRWVDRSTSEEEEEAVEEEEEEHIEEEEEELIFNGSDHEFSPESDIGEEADCSPSRHARTAKQKEQAVDKYAETYCDKCGKGDHPEWILLCDACDKGWHALCVNPQIWVIPEGEWFCPPCQHNMLITKLSENLIEYEKLFKKRENEVLRKQRLAYVGISLNNVLPSTEKSEKSENENEDSNQKSKKKSRRRLYSDEEELEDFINDDDRDESSRSGSGSYESEEEPIYQLRARRATKNFSFQEYDDMIKSALRGDDSPEPEEKETPDTVVTASNNGYAEQPKTEEDSEKKVGIDADESNDEDEVIGRVKKRAKIEDEETDEDELDEKERNRRKMLSQSQKKSRRRLNDLDATSEEDSDEDFKGSGMDDDEEDEDNVVEDDSEWSGGEESDDSIALAKIAGRKRRRHHGPLGRQERHSDAGTVRRSTRRRKSRIIYDESDQEEDDEDVSDKWQSGESDESESGSESDDETWGKKKKKKVFPAKSSFFLQANSSKKSKPKKKRKRMDEDEVDRAWSNKFGSKGKKLEEPIERKTRGRKINFKDILDSGESDDDGNIRPKRRRILSDSDEDSEDSSRKLAEEIRAANAKQLAEEKVQMEQQKRQEDKKRLEEEANAKKLQRSKATPTPTKESRVHPVAINEVAALAATAAVVPAPVLSPITSIELSKERPVKITNSIVESILRKSPGIPDSPPSPLPLTIPSPSETVLGLPLVSGLPPSAYLPSVLPMTSSVPITGSARVGKKKAASMLPTPASSSDVLPFPSKKSNSSNVSIPPKLPTPVITSPSSTANSNISSVLPPNLPADLARIAGPMYGNSPALRPFHPAWGRNPPPYSSPPSSVLGKPPPLNSSSFMAQPGSLRPPPPSSYPQQPPGIRIPNPNALQAFQQFSKRTGDTVVPGYRLPPTHQLPSSALPSMTRERERIFLGGSSPYSPYGLLPTQGQGQHAALFVPPFDYRNPETFKDELIDRAAQPPTTAVPVTTTTSHPAPATPKEEGNPPSQGDGEFGGLVSYFSSQHSNDED